jgi:hypothetical protein
VGRAVIENMSDPCPCGCGQSYADLAEIGEAPFRIGHISAPEPEPSILAEAEGLVNGARRDEYGPAEEGFAQYARGWSEIIGAEVTPTQVALCMAWLKICRELNGHKRDSLVDAAGYIHLAHVCAEAGQ